MFFGKREPIFNKPGISLESEVLRSKRQKKEALKPWTYKERLIVGGVLLATVGLCAYFYLRGHGVNIGLPNIFSSDRVLLE